MQKRIVSEAGFYKVLLISEIVEKFSRWIMAVIYIALGLFIIIEDKW